MLVIFILKKQNSFIYVGNDLKNELDVLNSLANYLTKNI